MKTNLFQIAVAAILAQASAYGQAGVAPGTNTGAVPAGTTLPAGNTADGFVVVNGRVYRIQNGAAVLITRPMAINVTPNGVFGFDGKPLAFPEGRMLSTQGGFVPLPSGITGLPPALTTTPPNLPAPGGQPTTPPNLPAPGAQPTTPSNLPPPGAQPTTPPNLPAPGAPPTTPPNLTPGKAPGPGSGTRR